VLELALPQSLGDLIRLGVTALKSRAKDKRYTVNLYSVHEPRLSTCHISMAGAFLSVNGQVPFRQKFDYGDIENTNDRYKLIALDDINRIARVSIVDYLLTHSSLYPSLSTLTINDLQDYYDSGITIPSYSLDSKGFFNGHLALADYFDACQFNFNSRIAIFN